MKTIKIEVPLGQPVWIASFNQVPPLNTRLAGCCGPGD